MTYAVAFDWDGTLLDSDYLLDQAVETVLKRHDASASLAHIAPSLYGPRPAGPLLRQLQLPVFNRAAIVADLASEYRLLEESAQPFEGALDLLQRLRQRGVALAVVTGRERAPFDAAVRRLGLSHYFQATVCAGEFAAKPSPDGLLGAKAAMHVDELVFVGNSDDDLKCAQSAGEAFIGVHLCRRARRKTLTADAEVSRTFADVWRRLGAHLIL